MNDSVYKIIELSGTSKTDIGGAINNAISKASETVHNMKWFEVIETRGYIEEDHVASWQVTVKIGLKVDEKTVEKKNPSGAKKGPSKQEASNKEAQPAGDDKNKASKYRCKVCGYIYDPAKGDDSQGVKPGTPFENLPDSWICPECGAPKSEFEKTS